MNSFSSSSPASRAIETFDRLTDGVATGVKNHWDDCYPMKPVSVPGAEIKDDNGNSYDPPKFEENTTQMVPDIEASQEFWDGIGTVGLPLCIGHAVMANGANFKHLLVGGGLAQDHPVMQAGMILFGAAIAFRDACNAAGLLTSLPIPVLPPVTLTPDATGKITVTP